MDRQQIIGVVEKGRFNPFEPDTTEGQPARLTRIQIQAAQTPESQEIDLSEHDGSVILVEGHPNGEWIFEAEVVDTAGPILTAVAKQVFAGSYK